MRLDLSQSMRLSQQMKLAPRIIQAMEILQLPMMALQERIDAELQSNPVLEIQEPGADVEPTQTPAEDAEPRGEQDLVVAEDNNSQDFERLAEFEAEYGADAVTPDAPYSYQRSDPERSDRKLEAMANTPAAEQSLSDYLHQQWAFIEADEPIQRAGDLIIDNIDEDGYMRLPFEELTERSDGKIAPEEFAAALALFDKLEPVGVGARDLRECLLMQLSTESAAGHDVSLETELVDRYLRDIEMNRLPQIAKRTDKTIEQIKQAIANISHLNPRPGLLIGQRTAPIINPDVIVEIDENDHVIVFINDGQVPQLYISGMYQKMAGDKGTDKAARQFIRRNIRSAEWIITAIQQRRETVRRVAEEVFKVQREFIELGPEALKPLPMANIAQKVGIHVATVSRAVAGKYAQTRRGIFPLRMFFSGGTTNAQGEDVSWDAIKAKLKELVDGEDKSKPLNDDELAEALQETGVKIARRTVAKYRKLMGILPARKRKQY